MLCLGVRKTGKLNFFANEILNLVLLTPLDFPDVVLKKLPTKIKSVASLRFKIIGKVDEMGLDLIFGVNDEAVEIEFNVHAFGCSCQTNSGNYSFCCTFTKPYSLLYNQIRPIYSHSLCISRAWLNK